MWPSFSSEPTLQRVKKKNAQKPEPNNPSVSPLTVLLGAGHDRQSLSLDDGGPANNQNALIEAVVKANPNTIVVVSTPGAVLMPWSGSVKVGPL